MSIVHRVDVHNLDFLFKIDSLFGRLVSTVLNVLPYEFAEDLQMSNICLINQYQFFNFLFFTQLLDGDNLIN